MYRIYVIARHTFTEAVLQPIFALILALGAVAIGVLAMLPLFTLGQDTRMFASVGLDLILILSLILTLLAASRSIFEEIEDRTMLTLMSKPVSRLQVLLGKYVGLIGAAALAIAVLGLVMGVSMYYRIPTDYLMQANSVFEAEQRRVAEHRAMHLAGVYPSLLLVWLQVSVLASLSVAISTRVSLVVNLPVVLLIYLAGNLARFIDPAVEGASMIVRGFGWIVATLLPFLAMFDLRELTVYSTIRIPGTEFANAEDGVTLARLWLATGQSVAYAALYATAAMALGLLLFRSRELGGAEG